MRPPDQERAAECHGEQAVGHEEDDDGQGAEKLAPADGHQGMMLSDGPTCAVAILPRGQENGRRAYRQYGRGLRRTHAAKTPGHPGCAAAAARCVAALARCPASRGARLLADRLAATQRRLSPI